MCLRKRQHLVCACKTKAYRGIASPPTVISSSNCSGFAAAKKNSLFVFSLLFFIAGMKRQTAWVPSSMPRYPSSPTPRPCWLRYAARKRQASRLLSAKLSGSSHQLPKQKLCKDRQTDKKKKKK